MPATAAIDNETLDHLLSVVDDSRSVRSIRRLSKRAREPRWNLRAISVGAAADCLSLKVEMPQFETDRGPGDDALLDSFVFASGVRIEHVWRAGRRVIADGSHVARTGIEARYRAALERLLGCI